MFHQKRSTHGGIAKPMKRSRLRIALGKRYYTMRRYLLWWHYRKHFAKTPGDMFQYQIITYSAPLLRRLKDVEMYLQYNKVINLRLAVAKLNRVILLPGETFSYWKLIGKPTKHRGYVEGLVLENGQCKTGIGGGPCQLSNMIYWLTLHTPLTVIERHRHDFDVFPDNNRTQPFGSGATCFYNYGDLMIYNDTGDTYQLQLEVRDSELSGCWRAEKPLPYRYEIYEKDHLIKPEFWGGYSRNNLICRKIYAADNTLIRDAVMVENQAIMMYEPLLAEQSS